MTDSKSLRKDGLEKKINEIQDHLQIMKNRIKEEIWGELDFPTRLFSDLSGLQEDLNNFAWEFDPESHDNIDHKPCEDEEYGYF